MVFRICRNATFQPMKLMTWEKHYIYIYIMLERMMCDFEISKSHFEISISHFETSVVP